MIKKLLFSTLIAIFFTTHLMAQGDTCGTATNIAVGASCTFNTYTNATATDSGELPSPGCANYAGADVWFSVTVPAGGSIIIDSDTGVITDSGMAIYSGACGALTLIECDDDDSTNGLMSSITRNGLTPGSTIYIRFWEYDGNNNGTFDLCVSQPPPPPGNDECASATTVGVNTDQSCSIAEPGTLAGATDSLVGGSGCFGTDDDDVWYVFQATNTSHTIDLINITGGTTDLYHAIYDAIPGCGSLGAALICSDPNSSIVSGLTVNNFYYVQVFSYTGSPNQTSDFDICIGTPLPPPSNDLCSGAIMLTSDLNCNYVTYTNESATDSGELPAPGCANYTGGDVWFTVQVPPSGELIIDMDSGVMTDSGLALYSGNCGTLSLIACDDDDSANGLMSFISQTGLTPGEILYLRVWEYGGNNNGTFDICVSTTIPPGTNGVTICEGDPSEPLTSDIVCAGADFGSGIVNSFSGYLDPGDPIATRPEIFITDASGCDFDNTPYTANYETATFTVSADGIYTFESNSNFDIMGYIVIDDGTWTAGNCPGTWTWITGDDDSGPPVLQALMTTFLQAGITYTLVTTAFSFADIVIDAPYTWNINTNSTPVEWYTTATGGTAIGTGAIFDPVGVAGSGLTNTNTAGTTSFWAGCPGGPRTQADYVINVCTTCKTWNGSIDSDWYNGINWTPSGIPSITDCVIIPAVAVGSSNPIADILNVGAPLPPAPGPFTAATLTVENGGFLIIDEDSNLIVNDLLTVENGGLLYIQNSGSIIQNNNVANVGTIYVERAPANGAAVGVENYVYWSTPVNGFILDNVSQNATTGFKWEWDPSINPNGPIYHGEWIDATAATMSNAKGYIVAGLGGNTANITVNHVAPLTGTSTNPVMANSAIFNGVPNNGNIMTTIYRGNYDVAGDPGYQGNGPVGTLAYNNDDNWNLIGNPYPSAISADAFIDANASLVGDFDPPPIIGTVWLWPHAGIPSSSVDPFYDDFGFNYDATQYIKHNRTGTTPPPPGSGSDIFIASGQAFFVFADHTNVNLATGSDLIFNNSMRSYDYANDNFYSPNPESNTENNSTTEKHRIWLNLLSTNNSAKTILIGYIENATDAKDRLFDGPEFNGFSTNFYSLIDYEKFAIQGKSLPFDDQDTIAIGVVLPSDDIYGISINSVDGLFENEAQNIFLKDTYENVIHDLRDSPYKFTSEAGTFNDRFIMRYTKEALGSDEFEDNSGIDILSVNNSINVSSGNLPINSIIVYDLLGRHIIDLKDLNALEYSIRGTQLSKGAYIVRATLYNGAEKIKKVVH